MGGGLIFFSSKTKTLFQAPIAGEERYEGESSQPLNAVNDLCFDAGNEDILIRNSFGVPRGLTRDINFVECFDVILYFITFIPRCVLDNGRLTTKIIYFDTIAHMWPLKLMQILTQPWKPNSEAQLVNYLSTTSYEGFARLSLHRSQLPIRAHLKRIEDKYDFLEFSSRSVDIDKFLNLVINHIMLPIEKLIKQRNFESNLLGLIPISIQYHSTSYSNEAIESDTFPLLSNKAVREIALKFKKLRIFEGDHNLSEISFKNIRDMLKTANNKEFDIR